MRTLVLSCGAPVASPVAARRRGSGPTIVARSGEVGVGDALRLRKEDGADRVGPGGHANEVMCYIPSERVLRENGDGWGWSPEGGRGLAAFQRSGSGGDAPFGTGFEDRTLTTVHGLLEE